MNFHFLWEELGGSGAGGARRRRPRLAPRRRQAQFLENPFQLADENFQKIYRLSKNLVLDLARRLKPYVKPRKRTNGLSLIEKILTTLVFYGRGSYQGCVGDHRYHQISQATVSRVIKEITDALNHPNLFTSLVSYPGDLNSRDIIKSGFMTKFGLPGVAGCIDGTLVPIIRPRDREEQFYSRKGYHALNVMIVCDSDLNILCVDPTSPGASHDSTTWNNHPLHMYINNLYEGGEYVYMLGDSGYPLRETLITPTMDAAPNTPEAYFYHTHVTARNVVERCIGVLKSRFRCLTLARKMHLSPLRAAKVVNACCFLHNLTNRERLRLRGLRTSTQQREQQVAGMRLRAMGQEIRGMADTMLREEQERRNSRNTGLVKGRAAQKALIHKVWALRTRTN